uniref:Uncharacterized protein n=1 Tax=Rhodosorus marinus TaxID=101924 RepID=A0A7S2ZJN5_9RHOD|mmetsp:Transcript_21859/g.88981  ORF Transcript_21859/g.88981 Transcript_21859/m.88981 type:complete len:385 (+) Transcript_21859:428-1582(+)
MTRLQKMLNSNSLRRDAWMVTYAVCLIGSLMVYNFMQERIMTKPYEGDGDEDEEDEVFFNNSLFLVLLNRIFASIAAVTAILSRRAYSELKPGAPIYKFYLISISNLLATTSQYEALKWITFPTQMLFKCAKLIPVMIMSTILTRKRYTLVDYAAAMCVGLGCLSFMKAGNITSRISNVEDNWIGIALMGINIGSDSFMTAFQESLFVGYDLSTHNQMLYVNFCSGTIGVLVLLYDGTLLSAFRFLLTHEAIRLDVFLLALGAVSGQFFITASIKNYGAVFFATVMTVQQICSVVGSSLIFGTSISQNQVIACCIVFGALVAKSTVASMRGTGSNQPRVQGPDIRPMGVKLLNGAKDKSETENLTDAVIEMEKVADHRKERGAD